MVTVRQYDGSLEFENVFFVDSNNFSEWFDALEAMEYDRDMFIQRLDNSPHFRDFNADLDQEPYSTSDSVVRDVLEYVEWYDLIPLLDGCGVSVGTVGYSPWAVAIYKDYEYSMINDLYNGVIE